MIGSKEELLQTEKLSCSTKLAFPDISRIAVSKDELKCDGIACAVEGFCSLIGRHACWVTWRQEISAQHEGQLNEAFRESTLSDWLELS
jgi:hypothetical protein